MASPLELMIICSLALLSQRITFLGVITFTGQDNKLEVLMADSLHAQLCKAKVILRPHPEFQPHDLP